MAQAKRTTTAKKNGSNGTKVRSRAKAPKFDASVLTKKTPSSAIMNSTFPPPKPAYSGEPLYVGIDLGTSQTAMSTSTGMRLVMPTYVGYSKDMISKELTGSKTLFGEQALKHRLSVNLVRPLAKGVIQQNGAVDKNKNLLAVQQLLKHMLKQVKPKSGQPIYAVIGAPARASINSQKILVDSGKNVMDAVMIVSEPFSVAYGMDVLDRALVIDIGAGTTDLCRLHGTMPDADDQITLDTAGDYVDEKLSELIAKKYPEAQFNTNMIRAFKEKNGFVSKQTDNLIVKLPVKGKPTEFDITAELRKSCKSIVPGMIKAIAKLISSYDPEFQEDIRSRIILAGGGSKMIGLDKLIEEGMEELGGGKVTRVDEPVYAGANGALKMAKRMPAKYWKSLAVAA
ncbi:MAG: rod shape-determining protein MreB [Candidatus Omnitrophota bacterium]|jgi:rod shape-determining protein MreB